jgi:4-diphosphocytidyl-2-C-methyl-D-erythritol kinase
VITLRANAKINIGLKILNKREDGFHNLETTFSTISLADEIKLEENNETIEIQCPGLQIPQAENICDKAVRLVQAEYNIKKGVKIMVIKHIPVGGGLGGGSADAAAVLKGLNELWSLSLSDEQLTKVGRKLGCDVPFLVRGGAAYARGLGDELKFFKLPKMRILIYYPGYPISTKWAYEEYDKKVLTSVSDLDIITGKKKKKPRVGMSINNDFEPFVFNRYPDLLDVKSRMLSNGAFLVSLSGSGSCLYAVVDDNIKDKLLKYFTGIGATYFDAETV